MYAKNSDLSIAVSFSISVALVNVALVSVALISVVGSCSKSVMSHNASQSLSDGSPNQETGATDGGSAHDLQQTLRETGAMDGRSANTGAMDGRSANDGLPPLGDGLVLPNTSFVNGDRTISASEHGTYFFIQNLARLFLPPASSTPAGTIYIFQRLTSDWQKPAFIEVNGADLIDDANIDLILLERGATIQLICDGQGWHILDSRGAYTQSNYINCGAPGNSCYQTAYINNRYVITPTNNFLINNGVGAWHEYRGDSDARRYLSPSGFDYWTQALTLDGKSFSGNPLAVTLTLGRKCPVNVYLSDQNKFATGKCILFPADSTGLLTNAASEMGPLNEYGTSQTVDGQIGLANHPTGAGAKWYTGNTQHCAKFGLRLATVYEVAPFTSSVATYPTSDGTPMFNVSAAPSVRTGNLHFTATGDVSSGMNYHAISASSATVAAYNSGSNQIPICLVPNPD